jgi:hypothetical protein
MLFFLNISRIFDPNAGVYTFSDVIDSAKLLGIRSVVAGGLFKWTSRMLPDNSSPGGGLWLKSPGAGVKGCGEITISLVSLLVMRLCFGTMID